MIWIRSMDENDITKDKNDMTKDEVDNVKYVVDPNQARKNYFLIGLTKIGMSFLWRIWGILMLMISRRNLID
jgi:hypothetical protein